MDFMVFVPLKCTCMPCLLQVFLNLFSQTLHVRNHNENIYLLDDVAGSIGVEDISSLCVCWVGVPVVVVFVFKAVLQSV